MIPVSVNGVTYKSISQARRELDSPVPEITIRWRLKNGWTPEHAFLSSAVPPGDRRTFPAVRGAFDEDSDTV